MVIWRVGGTQAPHSGLEGTEEAGVAGGAGGY